MSHTLSPDQLTLLSQPRARRRDPDTSRAAAKAVANSARIQCIILDVVTLFGSATDDEICCELYDMFAPTVKTARSRASKRGLLVDSGERRPSLRGRAQIVWRLP